MKLNTLRSRVVTWYAGLLAAALVVFGAILYFGAQNYLDASLRHTLVARAKNIGDDFLSHEEQKGPAWMGGEISETYAPGLSGRFIRITRQDGVVLYQSGDTHDPAISASTVSRPNLDESVARFRTDGRSDNLLIYTMPFRSSSGTRYLIETGASTASIDHALSSLRDVLIIITPLILIAAAFGGQLLMKVPLRPLVALSERAEQIGAAKLGERLPVPPTQDEMERLAHSLNRMIDRLEDALNHNRRFSTDVSHELRTPLTIMRGELEQVLDEPDLSIAVRDSVASAVDEIERMAKIVEGLLAIGRLDAGPDSIDRKPADVSMLCHWVIDQMRLLAEEKHIATKVITTPIVTLIDTARMKQVFVNLVDNAIKYTPEGGEIQIKSFAADSTAVIEVSDTGIGIAQEEIPHVFDRFFRADKVRSRITGGTGLGLSIVKAICHAHGGAISLCSTEGVGTTVRIELPIVGGPLAIQAEAAAWPSLTHSGPA